ncbi:MAG: class I SAM-dependent methyltransferase [Candidatus Omnitrophica bacterium]|nr:class I SAM-dependent methyltransferase [Candidatus Omnitrophota bacterium]
MQESLTLVKTEYGFYQYSPLPSREELREYYSQKYYQEGKGSYEVSYSDAELKYFRLKADLIYRQLNRLRDLKAKKYLLDIGCGEGWVLDRFLKEGHIVEGIDFSEYGLKSFNPHLLPYLKQGDYNDLILQKIKDSQKYDIIMLGNVIEHVLDPINLLETIKGIFADQGVLIIVAPNDFSIFHEHLLENKIIDEPFWLGYPDHISYFNKNSMENLLTNKGFRVDVVVADNPVDNNLLNKNSNYIKNPEKGKNIHYFRVDSDNFLASISEEKLLDIYEILGSMGVGRDLTYFCSK